MRTHLPELELFAAVARHKSFRRAALESRVSTSLVSQAVRKLEDQLGMPVLRKSITLRNPYTDVLSLLQTDLIRRARAGEGDKERLRTSLFLSINGIAAAMQSTG